MRIIYNLEFIMIYVEDVFKDSGIPTYTFVEPNEFMKLVVALRTKGRCLIIEGPSGIGKTTCLRKALEKLNKNDAVILSARKPLDCEEIKRVLTDNSQSGTIVVDDFHLLSLELKTGLSNLMKTIADEDRDDIKLVLIGINKAGDTLINIAPDLNNRITTIKFEVNSKSKILELIEKGECCLKIRIENKEDFAVKANGSFHIAQMLCKELCLEQQILDDNRENVKIINVPVDGVVSRIIDDLARVFNKKAKDFVVGSRLRIEGRAPYFHLLHWLATSNEWSIRMTDMYIKHPALKQSVSQVAEKGYLSKLIKNNVGLSDVIHYDEISKILTIEDPKFIFYLKNINWTIFADEVGFKNIDFNKKYDFALSFAGESREIAERLFKYLTSEHDFSVFYDFNEQHSILGENLEEYFEPIYQSEAEYVIVILDEFYPKKVWTNFESSKFKSRFGENVIIPIICNGCSPDQFSRLSQIGYLPINKEQDLEKQIHDIAELIIKKVEEKRMGNKM